MEEKMQGTEEAQGMLRVESSYFVAAAIFAFRGGWVCVEAAPILSWMIGKDPAEVRSYLERKGWRYVWSRLAL